MKILARICPKLDCVIFYGTDEGNLMIHISTVYGQVQYINTFWGANGKQWVLGIGKTSSVYFADLIQKGD